MAYLTRPTGLRQDVNRLRRQNRRLNGRLIQAEEELKAVRKAARHDDKT